MLRIIVGILLGAAAYGCDNPNFPFVFPGAAATTTTAATTNYTGSPNTTKITAVISKSAVMGWQAWVCLCACVALLLVLFFNLASCAAAMFSVSLFLLLCGIISVSDFLSGLSNPGAITIALLFIVIAPVSSLPLMRTVVAKAVASNPRFPGLGFARLKVCALSMGVSWFVNNTPLVAMLTPLLKQACRDLGESPAQMLMPMNFGTLIGGTFAVIGTSTNLIYDGLMRATDMGPMPFFEMIKVSGVPALLSLVYLVLAPKWLLPHNRTGLLRMVRRNASSFMTQMVVTDLSPLIGRQVDSLASLLPESILPHATLIEIVGISGAVIAPPRGWDTFATGDILLFAGEIRVLKRVAMLLRLRWLPQVIMHQDGAGIARVQSMVLQHRNDEIDPTHPSDHVVGVDKREDCHAINDSDSKEMTNIQVKEEQSPPNTGHAQVTFEPIPEHRDGSSNCRYPSMNPAIVPATHVATPTQHAQPHYPHRLRTLSLSLRSTTGESPSSPQEPLSNPSAPHVTTPAHASCVDYPSHESEEPLFVECVLSQRAQVLGQAVGSGAFQRRYGVSVLAMRKAGHVAAATSGDLRRCVLEVGDTLLVLGPASFVSRFEDEFLTAAIDDEHDDIAATLVDHFVIVPSWFPFGRTIDASVNIEHDRNRLLDTAHMGRSAAQSREPTASAPGDDTVVGNAASTSAPTRDTGARPLSTPSDELQPPTRKVSTTAPPKLALVDVEGPSLTGPSSEATPPLRAVQIPHWYRYLAVVIFAAMMGTTIGGIDLIYCAAVAAFAMVLLKLVSVQQAFAEIDLEVMIMVCFSFGLGKGMEKSGLAAVIGSAINDAHISGFPLMLVIAFAAGLMTNVITNKACAQVLFPVVYNIYKQQNKNPLSGVMVLAVVTSCAFSTPYGFATNLIILGPGGYTTKDFVKFGLPLNIFLIVGAAFMGSLVYGDW